MRHVDEGTIHAWLDEQITDPREADWIDEHLAGCAPCRLRLAEERSMRDQAEALLAATAPPGKAPAFSELASRAGGSVAGPGALAADGRAWVRQTGWAASLILALAAGWLARDLADDGAVETERAAAVTAPAEPSAADRTLEPAAAPPAAAAPEEPEGPARVLVADAPDRRRPASPPPLLNRAPAPPLAAVPEAPAAAQSAAISIAPQPHVVTITGAATAERTSLAPAPGWRVLPRTEAAARSGMPLYTIDGLEPVVTMLSADDRIVRTVYQLEGGDTVELEQQRAVPGSGSALTSVQATRRALAATSRSESAADAGPGPRVRSDVRGEVQVTLRTTSGTADLDAFTERLRVD